MRYILNDENYIEEITFGENITCNNKTCTEYTGTIPSNYDTLEEWSKSEEEKLNAWKIQDGNLVFDNSKYNELKIKYEKEKIDNTYVKHKDIYEIKEQIEIINDVSNSEYKKSNASGSIVTISNSKKIIPLIKLTNIECYNFNKIDLFISGKNMLSNTATTQIINGIKFTQNTDRSIKVNGTSTSAIEYNISGTSVSTIPLLCFKKGINYYLSSNNYTIKMYYYDGSNRTEIYSGTGGIINFTDNSKIVTQITLCIPNETTINNVTVYPQLEYGNTATNYEKCTFKLLSFNYSELISDDVFYPEDDLYPADDLYPKGTTIEYISINNGSINIKISGEEDEKYLCSGNINTIDGYNIIYAAQDTNINIEYCINELNINDLGFMQGKATKTNKFKVLDDGSIEAHNGIFSGNIYLTDGNKVVGGDGIYSNMQFNAYGMVGFDFQYNSSLGQDNNVRTGIYITCNLPDNFTITSAFITLYSTPINFGKWDDYDNTIQGNARKVKVYKVDDLPVGSYFSGTASVAKIPISQYLNGTDISAFGDNGEFWSSASNRKIKSSDISSSLNSGTNILLVANYGDNPSWYDEANTYTSYITAFLDVYGYTKVN